MTRLHALSGVIGIVAVIVLNGVICVAQTGQEIKPRIASRQFKEALGLPLQAKQFRLGDLQIAGNKRTRLYVILRMIPLNLGDIFDQVKWEHGLEQLNRSGLFEPISQKDIELTFDEAKGIVIVKLQLKERDHQRIDVNAGGGSTGGASIGLDYSNINVTGRADRLLARVRLGSRELGGVMSFSTTPLAKNSLRLDLSGFYHTIELVDARTPERGREPLFIERTGGASAGVSFSLTKSQYAILPPTRAGFVYSFTSTNLADAFTRAAAIGSDLEQSGLRIASFTPMILHYTLDREPDPLRGQQLTIGTELSARVFGGSLNTFRPSLDYRRFFPFGRPLDEGGRAEQRVFGVRLRALHIRGFGEPFRPNVFSAVRGVPIFRRFFLGGETDVRGFDMNSIAPLARVERFVTMDGGPPNLVSSDVRPIGGDTSLIFNAEYRVPIIWRLSAAIFFDLGGSFNLRGLREERFETPVLVQPFDTPATLVTVVRPLGSGEDRLPRYRASLGGELRFPLPLINIPLRLIFAFNPNAQRSLPESALLAPEKRFAFRFGFSRTL